MGGRFKREGLYIYTYGWLMLRFDRKQQNSVKQLSFNKKINSERKKMAVQLSCIEYSCWWFVASLTSFLPGTTSKVGDYSKGFRFLSLSHCFPFQIVGYGKGESEDRHTQPVLYNCCLACVCVCVCLCVFNVDRFLKSLLNLLQYCFSFMFWCFWPRGMWDLSCRIRKPCPCIGRQS